MVRRTSFPHVVLATVAIGAMLFACGCDELEAGAGSGIAQVATPRSTAANNPRGWPSIEFEPPELDFGILPPGGSGRAAVRIWNVGATQLTINRGIVSCGCTKADQLNGRVIQPGGFTEFNTTMEMKSGLGEKKEKLTIFFSGYERISPPVIFYFNAEVSLPVRAVPPHLEALDAATGADILTGEFQLEALDDRPFRVLAVNGGSPDYVDYDPARDAPRSRYTLRWDLRAMAAAGRVPWYWIVETDREDCAIIDIRVRHRLTRAARVEGRRWSPRDQRIVVGLIRNGEPFEVETKIQYPIDMTPSIGDAGVVNVSPILAAELLEARIDGAYLHYRIRLTALGAPPGLLFEEIRLQATDGDAPLRIIGRIVE